MTFGASRTPREPLDAPGLRRLLTQPLPDVDTTFDDAHRYTTHVLGPAVAAAVIWSQGVAAHEGADIGQLAEQTPAGTVALHLRYEASEPGSECLEVRVPCPHNPICRSAYDLVEGREDLLAVLDGAHHTADDVHCYHHDGRYR